MSGHGHVQKEKCSLPDGWLLRGVGQCGDDEGKEGHGQYRAVR